jgi:hypothetical protein
MNKQIESLLVEREGYVRRGLKDRVKAVDEALREFGYEAEFVETASVEPDEKAVMPKVVRKRKV